MADLGVSRHFNGWLPNVLVAFALTEIATAPAAMIQASSPLIVALFSHLLFVDERLTPQRFVGVLVGFIGMGILIGPAAMPDSGISLAGLLHDHDRMQLCIGEYLCPHRQARYPGAWRSASRSRPARPQRCLLSSWSALRLSCRC